MVSNNTIPDFRVKGNRIKEMSAAEFFRETWEAVKSVPEAKAAIDTLDYANATWRDYMLPGCETLTFIMEIEPGGNEGAYLNISVRYKLDDEDEVRRHLATVKTLDASADGFRQLGIIAGVWSYYANAAYDYSFDW